MEQYISKSALVAEIERRKNICQGVANANEDNEFTHLYYCGKAEAYSEMAELINTLEVKEVDLIVHTVIAECCDWLAMNTNLSHDKIEGCRNLMLKVKEEQLKAQKGEKV